MHTRKQSYLVELLTLLLYAGSLILIMYYHEPWFDEAQAWLIARDATIRELLTSITHYEGHPPLWFLILMPFAKLGVPFEIGIKSVNFVIVTLAMGIFIFKAPFKRIIRLTIPFTYFFFYQYGVLSRTYSLMMLGFVLSALFYKKRNEKPFHFIIALLLICGASVLGMVIAMGITIAWLYEIFNKSISIHKITLFLKSKTFYALLILLICNIVFLIFIYPYSDTYGITVCRKTSKVEVLFEMLFMMPARAILFVERFPQFDENISYFQLICCVLMSCVINITMYLLAKRVQKRALFILPYVLLIVFGGVVYFWFHHVGIFAVLYVFLLWCFLDETQLVSQKAEIVKTESNRNWSRYAGNIFVFIAIVISIYWSVCASINDIYLNYGTGRDAAKFIKDNELDKLNMLASWRQTINSKTGEKVGDYNSLLGIPELAYFQSNIFYNFNKQQNDKCYLLHKIDNDNSYVEKLIDNQYPDVLFGMNNSTFIFGTQISLDDYALVKSVQGHTIWKNKVYENRQYIFLRKDLLINYPHLKVLNLEDERI